MGGVYEGKAERGLSEEEAARVLRMAEEHLGAVDGIKNGTLSKLQAIRVHYDITQRGHP